LSQNQRKWLRYAVDFSAPLVFLLAYFLGGRDFMKATGASIVAALVALVIGGLIERRLAWLPLFIALAGIVFGGLTLFFHQKWILQNRPTVLNILLGGTLLVGLALGKNPAKAVLGFAIDLPDEAWRKLMLRFGVFYVFLGFLNLFVWLRFSEAQWVWFDTIGLRVLSIGFALSQTPLFMRYMKDGDVPPPPPETE
jgi:intracellular septation protein